MTNKHVGRDAAAAIEAAVVVALAVAAATLLITGPALLALIAK